MVSQLISSALLDVRSVIAAIGYLPSANGDAG